jgi:2'-5' RNA ligase
LTLKFLGDVPENKLENVKNKLIKLKFNSFEVELGDLGVFDKEQIRIVWVELRGLGLFELQNKIDRELKEFFPAETRFMGHITIARPKYVKDSRIFINKLKTIKFEKISFVVDKIKLYKSDLTPHGPVYSCLLELDI